MGTNCQESMEMSKNLIVVREGIDQMLGHCQVKILLGITAYC